MLFAPMPMSTPLKAQPVEDRFLSTSAGATLVVKACGFLEAFQGRILQVTEDQLVIRTGNNWFQRFFLKKTQKKRVEIRLTLRNLSDDDANQGILPFRSPHVECQYISVQIRPGSRGWTPSMFHEEAERLRTAIRWYFTAR